MKKRIFGLIAILLTVFVFVACKEDGNEKMSAADWNTTIDATVTQLTKADANYKITEVETDGQTTITVDGDRACILSAGSGNENKNFLSREGGKVYVYFEDEGDWAKMEFGASAGATVGEIIFEDIGEVLEESKTLYSSAAYSEGKYGFLMEFGDAEFDVKFTIAEGLVSKIEITTEDGTSNISIVYGGQTVVLPEVIEAMTQAQWETVMDNTIEQFTKTDANVKMTGESEDEEINLIVDGNKAYSDDSDVYYSLEEGVLYRIAKSDEVWVRTVEEPIADGSLAEIMLETPIAIMETMKAEYESFVFEDGKYTISWTEGEETVSISFTISDGLVSVIEFQLDGGTFIYFTYGGQSVTLPTVG